MLAPCSRSKRTSSTRHERAAIMSGRYLLSGLGLAPSSSNSRIRGVSQLLAAFEDLSEVRGAVFYACEPYADVSNVTACPPARVPLLGRDVLGTPVTHYGAPHQDDDLQRARGDRDDAVQKGERTIARPD